MHQPLAERPPPPRGKEKGTGAGERSWARRQLRAALSASKASQAASERDVPHRASGA